MHNIPTAIVSDNVFIRVIFFYLFNVDILSAERYDVEKFHVYPESAVLPLYRISGRINRNEL